MEALYSLKCLKLCENIILLIETFDINTKFKSKVIQTKKNITTITISFSLTTRTFVTIYSVYNLLMEFFCIFQNECI